MARHSARAAQLAILRVLLGNVSMVAAKIGVKYCTPVAFAFIRFAVSSLVAWSIARWFGATWPRHRSGWARIGILGVLQMALPTAFFFAAAQYLSVGAAAIVAATQPLVTALVARTVLGEQLSPRKSLGMAIGFCGVVFTMSARIGAGGREDSALGVVLYFLGILSTVGSTIFFKRYPPRESVFAVLVGQYAISAAVLLPMTALLEPHAPARLVINVPFVICVAALALGVGIIGQVAWQVLLAKGEASVASTYFFLQPIFGLAIGAMFLGELVTSRDAVGLLLTVFGVVLVARSGNRSIKGRAPVLGAAARKT